MYPLLHKATICFVHEDSYLLTLMLEKKKSLDYLLLLELVSAQLQDYEEGSTIQNPGTGVGRTGGWPQPVPAG